jgi:hypothetical protein
LKLFFHPFSPLREVFDEAIHKKEDWINTGLLAFGLARLRRQSTLPGALGRVNGRNGGLVLTHLAFYFMPRPFT